MLNKKVKKLSIRQIEKLAVKNASFKNMPTTWKTLNQLNVNSHKSFMSDILPLELSIGKNLDLIEEAIINKKNRNKSKHDLLSKNGYGRHTTNEKGQSKFNYEIANCTNNDSARKYLNLRKLAFQNSTRFIQFCYDNEISSFQYGYQRFNTEILKPIKEANTENSKQASHKRKTNKQANSKKEASNELSNKSLSLEFVSNITNDKTFKDKNLETCLKDCYSFIEIYLNENGLDFEKIMKTNKSNEIETFKKIFKIA